MFASREDRDGMLQSGMESGAQESYDRLGELLGPMRRQIIGTRVFDAPRALVFRAWAAEHVGRWWPGVPPGRPRASFGACGTAPSSAR